MAQLIGLILLLTGAAAMTLTVSHLLFRELRAARLRKNENGTDNFAESAKRPDFGFNGSPVLWIVFALIIFAGAFLRFDDLGEKSLSHPEAYVPGIELPADISEPPPRTAVVPLIWFHFHGEPHPPAYYFLMFVWTKIFGTNIESLRLPSVLFGIFSIIFAFLLGRELFSRKVGILSAALVAFNGHQIYWSQNARMYAMTCFLGLLSTYFLIRIFRGSERVKQIGWGAGYVAAACLGVYTEILFWVLLAGQMIFTLGRQRGELDKSLPGFVFRLQSLVVMLGAPMWTHAAYTGRSSPLEPISATFVGEFLAFGFLFERDAFSLSERQISAITLALIAAFSLVCAGFAFLRRREKNKQFGFDPKPYFSFDTRWTALFSIVTIIGFSLVARHDRGFLLLTCLVPAAAYFLPEIAVRVWSFYKRNYRLLSDNALFSDSRFLLVLLSFASPGLVIFVSLFNSLLASRLFLIFTPYLLILIAAGIVNILRRPVVFLPVIVFTVFLHAASVRYYDQYPFDVIDYKKLASEINGASSTGDTIFVHRRNWLTTPLFYHLNLKKVELTAKDFKAAVENRETRRVWLISFDGLPPKAETVNALSGFRPVSKVETRRGEAILYERSEP